MPARHGVGAAPTGVSAMEFIQIHEKYRPQVRKLVLSMVRDESAADDLIQETFVRVASHMHSVKDPSRMAPWIFRVARNVCIDHLRGAQKTRRQASAQMQGVNVLPSVPSQDPLEQHHMSTCVQDKMDLLPENLREVLVLHDMMELNHKEIAEVLGLTVENVKVRLHRARKRLQAILTEHCEFERDGRNVLVCTPRNPESGNR